MTVESSATMRMSPHPLLAGLLLFTCTAAAANGAKMDAFFRSLDPITRLVQVCDAAVMERTSHPKDGATDRAAIDGIRRTHVHGDVAEGDGGAFRRRGEWYEFAYRCVVTPDHMRVTDLSIDIKRQVPHAEWEANDLYP